MARPRRAAAPLEAEPIPAEPHRSPERQRLAEAIERDKVLKAEVAAAEAAIVPAWDAVLSAMRDLDAAEATLRDVTPREVNGVAIRRRPVSDAPPISIAEAKAAVDVARDALGSARRLREWHDDKLVQAQRAVRIADGDVPAAARAALMADPAVSALVRECRRRRTRYEAARRAVSAILSGEATSPSSPFYGWDAVADSHSGPEALEDWSLSRDWSAATAALTTDPDAPLPAL